MWLVMISNPSLRPPALNYLLRKLPKIMDREAVAVVLGGKENVSLMARAFASTLNDHQLLVQRGMLELLVQNFMLKSRMVPHDDLVMMMRAALGIVLRKDMSLNRRLYAWLLGGEGNSQTQLIYFNQFAEKPATQAIRSMLQENTQIQDTVNQQRPYKILISLMDKWELGQPIVNNIFIDALNSLKLRSNPEVMQTANMWMDMMEPYMVCMKLFDMMDTCFPGNNISSKRNTNNITKNLENMKLIEFTLDSFKLTDEEIKQIHFPFMLASLVKKLKEALKSPTFIEILPQVSQCISLISIILDQLPEAVFVDRPILPSTTENSDSVDAGGEGGDEVTKKRKHFTPDMNVVEYAREFYGLSPTTTNQQVIEVSETHEEAAAAEENEEGGDLSISAKKQQTQQPQHLQQPQRNYDPLRGQIFVKEVVDNLVGFLIDFVNSYIAIPDDLLNGIDVGVEGKRLKHIDHHLERVLLGVCTAITTMAKHANTNLQLKRGDELTQVLLKCCQQVHVFGVVDAGLSTLTLLVKQGRFVQPNVLKQPTQVKAILDQLWGFLSPSMQLLHMRTVELLWLLTDASLPHQIETILSNYLIHQPGQDDLERLVNYEKFGIIWELSENMSTASAAEEASVVFTRPMFLMLDLLREGASPLDRRAGETWIRCHLKSYVRLLEPFLMRMLDKQITRRSVEYAVQWEHQTLLNSSKKKQTEDGATKVTQIPYYVYLKPFDTEVIDYMLNTLNTLITFGGLNVLKTCKNHIVDSEGLIAKAAQASLGIDLSSSKSMSFLDLLVSISVR